MQSLDNQVPDKQNTDTNGAPGEFFVIKFKQGLILAEIITQQGQNEIPQRRSQNSVDDKGLYIHFCQSSRYGNQLTDTGYEAPNKGGGIAIFDEIILRFLDFIFIE